MPFWHNNIDPVPNNVRLRGMRVPALVLTMLVGTIAAAQTPGGEKGGEKKQSVVETKPEPGDGDDDGDATPAAAEEEAPRSQFTIAFAGGALVPQGAMGGEIEPGLDVWGRVGWITPSGLGVVMHLEYAPLRPAPQTVAPDAVVDAHLFAATAGPRFTLGRHLLRAWLAGGAGVVVQRVQTTSADLSKVTVVDTVLGVSGGGGLDVYFLGSGGVTLAGAYTRGMSSGAEQQYVSVNAGLVFVY